MEDLRPGICLTIPLGTASQFRADGPREPLQVAAVTMPPWPTGSEEEARPEQGPWTRPCSGVEPAQAAGGSLGGYMRVKLVIGGCLAPA